MLKTVVTTHRGVSVVIADSITKTDETDIGHVVVSASHGGRSSGEFALEHRLGLVLFNDAGVGKDGAGTAALDMLAAHERPAAAISHTSARIGDARDHWSSGVISSANTVASAHGVRPGATVQEAVIQWIDSVTAHDE